MSPAVERKAAPADLSLIGGPEPLPDAVVCERLETLRDFLDERSRKMLGFPGNQDINYSALAPFLGFNSNNAGDPYIDGNYGIDSHRFERAVLEFFQNPWPRGISPDHSSNRRQNPALQAG